MNLHQLFSILRARWLTAFLILSTVVGAALAWVLLRPSEYTARAPVLVDVQAQDVGGGYSPNLINSYLATQMDVARSDRVTEQVLQQLLADPPAILAEPFRAVTPQGQHRERIERLQENLSVRPSRESNIINIAWTASTPAEAARVANLFAQTYVNIALELKTHPAKQESTWFDEQVAAARQRLEQAQQRLTDYQQRAGIVGEEVSDHEMARLTTLAQQLAQVQALNTDAMSKRGQGGSVSEVIQSPLVNSLKGDIARLEGQLQQSAATLGPRHPTMLRLEAELQALRGRLAAESRTIVGSIDTSYQVGQTRERELLSQLNAQRSRVLAVNRDRGQLALLRQDMQAAQQAFAQVNDNASKVRLQSLTQMTNLRLLNPAVEPRLPVGMSKRNTVGLALGIGIVLALAGALLMELLNRRVRTIEDVILATQLPVLATVPAASPGFAALTGGRRPLALSHGSAS